MLREKVSKQNALAISEYINSLRREINLSIGYRKANLDTLVALAKFHSNKKDFKKWVREDILLYLDSLGKPEASDPLHKWIGTYNLRRAIIVKFFKWLCYPDTEPNRRIKPKVVENIVHLKRKEQSIYKPADLWAQEDDLLFLKYCPSKRDRLIYLAGRMNC